MAFCLLTWFWFLNLNNILFPSNICMIIVNSLPFRFSLSLSVKRVLKGHQEQTQSISCLTWSKCIDACVCWARLTTQVALHYRWAIHTGRPAAIASATHRIILCARTISPCQSTVGESIPTTVSRTTTWSRWQHTWPGDSPCYIPTSEWDHAEECYTHGKKRSQNSLSSTLWLSKGTNRNPLTKNVLVWELKITVIPIILPP